MVESVTDGAWGNLKVWSGFGGASLKITGRRSPGFGGSSDSSCSGMVIVGLVGGRTRRIYGVAVLKGLEKWLKA